MSEQKALLTPWGEALDRDCPLNDYPRPQLKREQWTCLNGRWRYAVRDHATPPEAMDGDIVVPFSPESVLSGVGRTLWPNQTLWYERELELSPIEDGKRLLLHFGAVDQCCTVWLNGVELGSHEGGYTPFTLDATDRARNGANTLRVRVRDATDQGDEAYGKQRLKHGGIWYGGQSGIWQTVWMELVPQNHITSIKLTPRCDCVAMDVAFSEQTLSCRCEVWDGKSLVASAKSEDGRFHIAIPDGKLWSPDSPFLYTLQISAGEDHVESYVGLREFGVTRGKHGRSILTLNGKPIFQHGLLDQGYWSDGLYTAPDDRAMIWEIEQLKALGFNMLRKHIKVEPLRWYYHCDRLGMLVWQDFVNGGGPYSKLKVQVLPWLGIRLKDTNPKRFARESKRGRDNYWRDARRTMELLQNCVGLCCWTPFNEGWGQFDAAQIAERVKTLDPTRYVDHASGYHDQHAGDFQSKHVYYKRFRPTHDRQDRVLALTEFGGYSLPCEQHMASAERFGYKIFETSDAFNDAWRQLYEDEVIPAISKGLSVAIYTQVSDVQEEINGLFSYDRRVMKLEPQTAQVVRKELERAFEAHVEIGAPTQHDKVMKKTEARRR